jgi:hypothetical protein
MIHSKTFYENLSTNWGNFIKRSDFCNAFFFASHESMVFPFEYYFCFAFHLDTRRLPPTESRCFSNLSKTSKWS